MSTEIIPYMDEPCLQVNAKNTRRTTLVKDKMYSVDKS